MHHYRTYNNTNTNTTLCCSASLWSAPLGRIDFPLQNSRMHHAYGDESQIKHSRGVLVDSRGREASLLRVHSGGMTTCRLQKMTG